MSGPTDERGFESKVVAGEDEAAEPLERTLRERLRGVREPSVRRTIAGLAREIGKLPADVARAALEVTAGLASVSLRAGVDFLRVVPGAARVLDAEELRAWGDLGRRLTMADAETGAAFFAAGTGDLAAVPRGARLALFQVCARQLTLSTSIALDTLRRAPEVARSVADPELLRSIFEVALEVARRSAKHSADFIAATPRVGAALDPFRAPMENDDEAAASISASDSSATAASSSASPSPHEDVARAAVALAQAFATRAGGIAADVWEALPDAVEGLGPAEALRLFRHAEDFLDRGGAAAQHALTAGGEVLRVAPDAFDDWALLLRAVADHSNAALVALARSTPCAACSLSRARSRVWTPRPPSTAFAPRRRPCAQPPSSSSSAGRVRVWRWRRPPRARAAATTRWRPAAATSSCKAAGRVSRSKRSRRRSSSTSRL